MKFNRFSSACLFAGLGILASPAFAQSAAPAHPYSVINTAQLMGSGGIDYVYADSIGRRLYVPRNGEVLVFDLDTLKPAGSISGARGGHGAAVDPKSHHGFSSSNPIVMWDTQTLATIKTITPQGNPDGIYFEPQSARVYVFSHSAPNATVINPEDGSIVGTIDLGGAPEQAQSDGQGNLYVDLEDKNQVAVVDVKTLKVTGHYDLGGSAGPAGLGLDAKKGILFAFCRNPATAVILSAKDGKIITTLPIGNGTDGGGFNPNTMEAFSSQRDGTLTIIKESSPTSFAVEQNVQTKQGAKTCTLDTKTDHIVLITTERAPTPPPAADAAATNTNAAPPTQGQGFGRRGGRGGGPSFLDIIVVGR